MTAPRPQRSCFAIVAFLIALGMIVGYSVVDRGGDYVRMCANIPRNVATQYTDLISYELRTPDLAIDAVVLRESATPGAPDVVLCNRSRPPPLLAIPGGYVEYGEAVEIAFVRELVEETGIDLIEWLTALHNSRTLADQAVRNLRRGFGRVTPLPGRDGHLRVDHYGLYANPRRDLRRHTASSVYVTYIPRGSRFYDVAPKAHDDVKHCQFWPLADIIAADDVARRGLRGASIFAFDHGDVLRDVLESVRREAQETAVVPAAH